MKRILSLVGVVLVVGSFYWFRGPPSDGPYEIYHDNGQLWVKGTYKDGEECGEWVEEGETVTSDPC